MLATLEMLVYKVGRDLKSTIINKKELLLLTNRAVGDIAIKCG